MSLSKMVQALAFEQIQDKYWYGAFGDFKLIIDMDDEYVNATKMCSDAGKRFFKWFRQGI